MPSLNVLSSYLACVARPYMGNFVQPRKAIPEQPLQLYDFEACPFCRKAREALSALALRVEVYPCPKNGERFRPGLIERGGRRSFPYLIDPNTGTEMYESDDIVRYAFDTYGQGSRPVWLHPAIATPTSSLASAARLLHKTTSGGPGMSARPSRRPEELLILYGYEGSPYCRLVREVLCELELPYLLRNIPRRAPEREAFIAHAGKMQVPYLIDPNTGVEMFESADIMAYLEATYGA